jgi:hypothetical protein
MRRDFWEIVGLWLLLELTLRVVHAVCPNLTEGYLPITGDDIRQTGVLLMTAIVAYGLGRFWRPPPPDEPKKKSPRGHGHAGRKANIGKP